MWEQETASITKFIMDAAGNPNPYYYKVPQSFLVPAIYFPAPQMSTNGEAMNHYKLSFTWFIKFFHKTTQEAYTLAYTALQELKRVKHLLPIVDDQGVPTGEYVRLNDPSLNMVDDGTVQLQISWDSRRPYYADEVAAATDNHFDLFFKTGEYAETAIPEDAAAQAEQFIPEQEEP
ncbi:MAG: hypothetical protein LBJ12_00980 [Oscillospiraceae bacterium]|jgi:hypothetical protein|nr:hypothetical protein [Oscillospiraceae bacterium]